MLSIYKTDEPCFYAILINTLSPGSGPESSDTSPEIILVCACSVTLKTIHKIMLEIILLNTFILVIISRLGSVASELRKN